MISGIDIEDWAFEFIYRSKDGMCYVVESGDFIKSLQRYTGREVLIAEYNAKELGREVALAQAIADSDKLAESVDQVRKENIS